MESGRKKILFVVTKAGMGGASRYVYDLARSLSTNHDVLVVAGGDNNAQELFEKCAQENIRTSSIPTLERNIHFIKEIKTFLFFVRLFKEEHPDTIHLNSPKAGGLGALAARMVGIKNIIYTTHGWAFFEDRPFYQKIFIYIFSYITLLLSTKTIAVSKHDVHAIRFMPFAKQKIVYIPNGVSLYSTTNKEEARNALHSFDIPKHTLLVGTVAELHKNKGLVYLIDAMKDIENAICIIIGEGEERTILEKHIHDNDLDEVVFLAGYIENAATLIPAFDVFVLPSIKEGLPYVLLEAGARGIPVVASSVGGIPEVIEDKVNGLLIHPKHTEKIHKALQSLLEDEALRTTLGEALKEKIEKNFSLDNMIQETVALY